MSNTKYLRFERREEIRSWSSRTTFAAVYLREQRPSDANLDHLVRHRFADGTAWIETSWGMEAEVDVYDMNSAGDHKWVVKVSQSAVGAMEPWEAAIRAQLLLMACEFAQDWEKSLTDGRTPHDLETGSETVQVPPLGSYNFADPTVRL